MHSPTIDRVLSFDDPLPARPARVLVAGVSGVGKTTLAARIPEIVDADKIDAKLTAGVLYLHLPKASRARPRQISVKAG